MITTLMDETESNTLFIEYFKNLLTINNISVTEIISNFNKFEQNTIFQIEQKYIVILRTMLDKKYYKNLNEVNVLVKFRILQQTLELLKSDELDNDIINKLENLFEKV